MPRYELCFIFQKAPEKVSINTEIFLINQQKDSRLMKAPSLYIFIKFRASHFESQTQALP